MDEHIKGKWLGVVNSPGDLRTVNDGLGTYGVHAAMLNTGRVIIWSGRVESSGYLYRSWTWDATTFTEGDTTLSGVIGRWFLSDFDIGGASESPPGPAPRWSDERTIDLFCAHHTNLEDGQLLVVGGAGGKAEADARGNPAIYTYDPDAERWTKANHELRKGRWYPTQVTMHDGRVAIFSGRQKESSNPEAVAEVLGPPDFQPTEIAGANRKLYIYPGLVLTRGGRIFYVPTNWLIEDDPTPAISTINPTAALKFTSRTSATWETFPDPADPSSNIEPINPYREEGTFVLLPPAQAGRILVIGGGFAEDALAASSDQRSVARPDHCEILETQGSSPRWVEAGTMHNSRVNVSAVLLPDGKVLILGGHSSVKRNPSHVDRLNAEIFDPTVTFDPSAPSAAFTETAVMGTSRNYHSSALLLPDGRVLVAGGEDNPHFSGNQTSIELYEPPYLHKGAQPSIARVETADAPDDEIAYGRVFDIECASDAETADIDQVVLMRPGSPTHHTDTEQRHVPLNFSYMGGTTLRATAPLDPTVAPPGYYMLWVVDSTGRPCKRAPFVRLSYRRCQLITDRSTIGLEEIQALPSRTLENAIYVHVDGFLPQELGITSPTPSPALIEAWAPTISAFEGTTALTNVRLRPTQMLLEDPAMPPDLRQRITFRYSVRFDDLSIFPPEGGPDRKILRLEVNHRGWGCGGNLNLTRQPAPYMLDGAKHWLSTDVRVFKVRAGETRFGVTLSASNPIQFLRDVLGAFDADPSLAAHPFETLPTDQAASRLQLAETEGGTRVFNFAVCRVRYRALTLNASRVRVHFRMFTTAATNLDWNPSTTYRRQSTAGSNIATPGLDAGEVVTIPFFGRQRVDASTTSLASQTDDTNEKDINAFASGAENRRYFGALLDINQPTSRLPDTMGPTDLGPFPSASLEPIADLIRGRHQCLVAEVDFALDPIQIGASPANDDKLSQRNLAIEESDNPGGEASHTVAMSFDVNPTWARDWARKYADLPDLNVTRAPAAHGTEPDHEMDDDTGHGDDANGALDVILTDMPPHFPPPRRVVGHLALGDLLKDSQDLLMHDPVGARFAPVAHEHRPPPNFSWFQPDDLMIEWGEIPQGTIATLFLPNVETDHIIRAARLRSPWPRFDAIDDHTLRLGVGGVSHIPLPTLTRHRVAGLLTLELPENVRSGQVFHVVVRQASNLESRIVGAFELKVSVTSASEIAIDEARWYAVLQHIVSSLDGGNRWRPVLERLLGVVKGRVAGFGLDPESIDPSLNPEDLVDPCPCCDHPEDHHDHDECQNGDGEDHGHPGQHVPDDKGTDPTPCPNPHCECDPCRCEPPCKCGLRLAGRTVKTTWSEKRDQLIHKVVETYSPDEDAPRDMS